MVPRHELLHSAELADHFNTRTQIKMVGVVQQDLHAELFQRVLGHALHRRNRSYRHKHGGLDFTVRREEAPGAGRAIACFNLKAERHRRRL